MVKLYRDPKGEKIFTSSSSAANSGQGAKLRLSLKRGRGGGGGGGGKGSTGEKVKALEEKVAELELQIKERKVRSTMHSTYHMSSFIISF